MKRNEQPAVIMTRVSSKEQRDSGYSLQAQEKLLREYAHARDMRIDRTYSIAETASKAAQRKKFAELMDFMRENDVKLLVVEKVDRLTRSLKDLVLIDEWLEQDPDRHVHFVKDSLVLHRDARSQEKLSWGIRVVLAKNFIDNLKEEVEKGRMAKLESGGLPGRHPIGYATVGPRRGKQHVADPTMGPLATRMFHLYLEPSHSLLTLLAEMNRLGMRTASGRPLTRTLLWKMLGNSFYIGKIPWKGRIYNGTHPPLIDIATFRAVQEKLSGRRAPRYSRHNSLFRGLIRCGECRCLVTWEIHKGRYYGRCHGYRDCTRRSYLREDRVDEQIPPALGVLRMPDPKVVPWVEEWARRQHDELPAATARIELLTKRRDDLSRRLNLAYDDRLDGRITAARYDEIEARYKQERDGIQQEIEGIQDRPDMTEYYLDILRLCQRADHLYVHAGVEERRQLVLLLFSNLWVDGQKLAYDWDDVVEVFAQTAEEDRQLHSRFEPEVISSPKRKGALLEASCSLWCARLNDLRTLAAQQSPKHIAAMHELPGHLL